MADLLYTEDKNVQNSQRQLHLKQLMADLVYTEDKNVQNSQMHVHFKSKTTDTVYFTIRFEISKSTNLFQQHKHKHC